MPHRKPELRQLIDGLALGLDALVRAHWGSDASSFATAAVRELERRGYEVIHVLGTTRRAATQFGALRFSIEDLFRGSSDPITVVDRLCARIMESARPVLVIENADLVDPLSLEILHDAVERTGCRQVILLSEVPVSDTSPLVHPPVQVITLAPPSYSAIEDLIRGNAASVSDAWVRRAYIDSGGSPEIISAILADATPVDTVPHSLDSESVLAVVGSKLAELPPPLFACLRGVAMENGVALRDGIDRFGASSLESLERAGLVTVSRGEGGAILSCPPLIVSYFTSAGGSIADPDQADDTPDLDQPLAVQQLARDLDGRAASSLAAARTRLQAEDSPRTRAELAAALWISEAPDDEIESVLLAGGDPDLPLSTLRAHWLASRGRIEEARREIAEAPRPTEADECLADAEALLLDVQYDRVPKDLAARVSRCAAQDPADRPEAASVLALVFAYAGLLDEARSVLPASPPSDPRQRARWELASGLIAIARGRLSDAEELATRGLASAARDRDRDLIQVFGYLCAIVRLFRGKWAAANALLSGVRSLGRASAFLWPLHRSLRGMHAIVLAADGKGTLATALAAEAQEMLGNGPIAATREGLAELVDAFLRRDAGGVASGFSALAEAASSSGFGLAEECYRAIAVALEPTRALPAPQPGRAAAAWSGWPHVVALTVALAANDSARVAELIGEPTDDAFQFLMLLALSQTLAATAALDSLTPEARGLTEFLSGRVGTERPGFRVGSVGFGERISDREREVALLAATLSNAEIARRLGVSKRTIDHHISNALRKTGARTRLELNALVRESVPVTAGALS